METGVGAGLGGRIAERARRFGSIPWSAFMEMALYDADGGFYQAGGRAGRTGDFITSPELGPLFATACARFLDQCWEDLRYPDPFVVVEAAAGAGTLARDILAASPACAPALRYVLVERSAALRAAQAARLPIELPALVLGPAATPGRGEDGYDDDERGPQQGIGPLVTALEELPAVPVTGVILANELLDNLPVDLLEYRDGRWHEVRVAAAVGTSVDLVELLVPASADVAAHAERLVAASGRAPAGGRSGAAGAGAADARAGRGVGDGTGPDEDDRRIAEGARIPVERAAVEWVRQALSTLEAGWLVVVDYADTTGALARRPPAEWLRTFRQHQRGASSPLHEPGSQDITCVVAVDQLAAVRLLAVDCSQAEWLAEHGMSALADAARQTWRDRAALGDLESLKARSRVHEAGALSDPAGLGGHRVLQWRAP